MADVAAKPPPEHSGPTWRGDVAGALWSGGLVLLFFTVLLASDPLLFWNDDYALSILPVFADVARSWSEGQLPLLSPYSWICSNLAGEFQYGTFSVFVNVAVILIWKLPLSFPQQAAALSLVHLFVLAMGGFALARGRNLTRPLAVMVGLIAALNGWIVCWGAIDWFGALAAFAWMPWAWWGLERALDSRRGPTRFLWPVPFVYLLICGGFPYTVVMLALLIAWLCTKSLLQTRELTSIWPLVVGTAFAVALAAPAWIALFDYLSGSAREAQDSAAHRQWVVPPAALPAFILPAWTVKWADFSNRLMPHTATEMAFGLVAPAALLFALLAQWKAFVRQARWELALLLVVLMLCMLPTASVFRWSFRWLPFLHLILALCAAQALRHCWEEPRRTWWSPARLGAVLVCAAAIAMWFAGAHGPHGWKLTCVMLLLAAGWALAEVFCATSVGRAVLPAAMTFASLLATYLCIPPNVGVPKYNLDQALTRAEPLDPARLYISFYPAPEQVFRVEAKPEPTGLVVRPGSTSMWGAVRFVNGYSPIRSAGAAREFGSEIHGELAEWARTSLLEGEAGPDGLLQAVGVDGIIVASELALSPAPASEWELVHSAREGRVYHRRGGPLPHVRSVVSDAGARDERFVLASVATVEDSRHRVEVDIVVPAGGRSALLTFSRPYFRGYQAEIGGTRLPVIFHRGLMPAVEVPAGMSGRLVLQYRPRAVTLGGAIAGASLLSASAAGLLLRRRSARAT